MTCPIWRYTDRKCGQKFPRGGNSQTAAPPPSSVMNSRRLMSSLCQRLGNADRKKPQLNGASVRIWWPTRRDWRRIGTFTMRVFDAPINSAVGSVCMNNMLPIVRNYNRTSQFLCCVSHTSKAPLQTRDNMSKLLNRSFDFIGHEERCILSQSCVLNGGAEFPFGRQWAARMPSAGAA